MPWTLGVSFLQAEHRDNVPMWDLGLYFPGDGHTKGLLSHFSLGICAVQLLANLSAPPGPVFQDAGLHYTGAVYSLHSWRFEFTFPWSKIQLGQTQLTS